MQRLTECFLFEQGDPFDILFQFCIFVQWAASVKLLIMFVLLKVLFVLKIYFILSFWDGIYFLMSVLT